MTIEVQMLARRPKGPGEWYEKGVTYPLSDDLASAFIRNGVARRTALISETTGFRANLLSGGAAFDIQKSSPIPLSVDPASGGVPEFQKGMPGAHIDYRAFGDWLKPGQDVGGNWQKVIDQMPAGAVLNFGTSNPGSRFLFSQGATVRKRLGFVGGTFGSRIDFIPSVAQSTWLTFDGVNGPSSEVTDELQLDGGILLGLKLYSDRSVRAHALRFRRCDNFDLRNLFAIGFAGRSLTLENSREFSVHGFRTRFNGYMDTSSGWNNLHMSDPDWLWHGPSNFFATATTSVPSAGSRTITLTNTNYTDPDGVILGLSVGASFTIDDGTAADYGSGLDTNAETVVVTSISGLNVTATFTKPHSAGAEITIASDNTNYCICHDVKLIFPFWNALEVDNTSSQTIAGVMIHMLPDGTTDNGKNLEGNVVRWFGGSKGFTGGVANNVYAALHKPSTGDETSASGLKFDPQGHMWAAPVVARDAKKLRISDGVILGGQTHYVVRAEGNGYAANAKLVPAYIQTEVSLSNIDIGAANSSTANLTPFSQVGAQITVDTSTDVVTLGGTLYSPPTGYPVLIRHASNDVNIPSGLTGFGQCMYAIRTGPQTLKLAKTRKQALKGVAVDITSTGTGTTYLQLQSGVPISAWNSAKVFIDPTVRLSDGMQAFSRDSGLTAPLNTTVVGVATLESNFSVQNVFPFLMTSLNTNSSFAGVQLALTGEKVAIGATPSAVLPIASANQAVATDATTTQNLANALRSALLSLGVIKGSA